MAGSSVAVLHAFAPLAPLGAYPQSTLAQGADGNFYGTTPGGGAAGVGTIFDVTSSGVISVLYSFTNGLDGGFPRAGLTLGSDGYFYGAADYGGSNGVGTVFKISNSGVFTSLYSFRTNAPDGQHPEVGLVEGPDGSFYGTTQYGGSSGQGTIYSVTPTGAYTNLHSFATFANDGANPNAPLILANDGNFYGTTSHGGTRGQGTVFRITPQGVWTNLYSFTNTDGALPWAALVQATDGTFYATTYYGGLYGYGSVFSITTNGIFTPLHSFSNGADGSRPRSALAQGPNGSFYGTTYGNASAFAGTNTIGTIFQITSSGSFTTLYTFTNGADGANPLAGLVLTTNGNFIGTTDQGGVIGWGGPTPSYGHVLGGTSGWGTVFTITPDGQFTSLCAFPAENEGANPGAGLIQAADGFLYGVTERGGTNDDGTVFRMDSSGTVTTLYSFTSGPDGAVPAAALTQGSDGNFYGTSYGGSPNGSGAVFKITPAGSLTVLHTFTNGLDGSRPLASLIQGADGNFYGTTTTGQAYNGSGTVFRIATDGTFTTLHVFTNGVDGSGPLGLVQGSNRVLYGVAQSGGPKSNGVVFTITTSGSFSTLYSFTGGIDGAEPLGALTSGPDGNFYGVCRYGGDSDGDGTIFTISPSGQFTQLHTLNYTSEGGEPQAPLVFGSDGTLYGATTMGGDNGYGTVFQIATNGNFKVLHSFAWNEAGPESYQTMMQATNGSFYITGEGGGGAFTSNGAILRLIVSPTFVGISNTVDSTVLTWSAEPGQNYQIQRNDGLDAQGWSNVNGPVTATQPIVNFTTSNTGSSTTFYRLLVVQ